MRQAVIQVTCDLCKNKFDEDDASNFKMQNGNDPMVEFDACHGCADALSPFFAVARNVVVPKKPGRKRMKGEQTHIEKMVAMHDPDRTIPCPVKGCTFMGKSNQSLATHNARTHKEQS